MTSERITQLKRAALVIGIWLVPGLLQCVQEVTYAQSHGGVPQSTAHILLHFLPTWLPWAAFTPAILALSRRFPLVVGEGGLAVLLPRLLLHSAGAVAFGGAHLLMIGLVRVNAPPGPWADPDLWVWLRGSLWSLQTQAEVLAYAGVLVTGHALVALRAARERELRAVRLEAQLARSRLDVLQSQLQPHFLFNTLNAIDVLITEDPKRATTMLLRLSDLLRMTLERTEAEHTLRDELAHLECYLDIERVRFSDRLDLSVEAEQSALDCLVPSLVLQPLVENALRHGLAPRAEGGRLTVSARLEGGELTLCVEDDGVGLSPDHHEGLGLGNTRARLRGLHGDRGTLTLSAGPGSGQVSGTRVTLRLPVQRDASHVS